jgi:hypothetical protein
MAKTALQLVIITTAALFSLNINAQTLQNIGSAISAVTINHKLSDQSISKHYAGKDFTTAEAQNLVISKKIIC